jgi:hypothetical protein
MRRVMPGITTSSAGSAAPWWTCPASVSRNDRDRLDGQEQPPRKRNDRRGPRRRVRWEILSVEAIRNFTILQISHEGRGLDNVLQITAGGLQDGLEIPDGLSELGLEPTRNRPRRGRVGGCAEVNTRLPATNNKFPTRTACE